MLTIKLRYWSAICRILLRCYRFVYSDNKDNKIVQMNNKFRDKGILVTLRSYLLCYPDLDKRFFKKTILAFEKFDDYAKTFEN